LLLSQQLSFIKFGGSFVAILLFSDSNGFSEIACIKEILDALNEEWKRLPISLLESLVDSMPRRCKAVIEAKGFPTTY